MAELELLSLNGLVPLLNASILRQNKLASRPDRALAELLVHFVVKLPELDDAVVCRQHLQCALLIVDEFDCIDLLVELNRLQVIEFRLVRLDLREVPIIEVARILQLVILEYDDSSALVTDSQILACLIIADRRQQIILGDVFLVALTKPVDVDPVGRVGDTLRIDLRLALRLVCQVLRRHHYLPVLRNICRTLHELILLVCWLHFIRD